MVLPLHPPCVLAPLDPALASRTRDALRQPLSSNAMAPERDLFANFERMRREMDELFGDVFERTGLARRRSGFSPPIDVYYAVTD